MFKPSGVLTFCDWQGKPHLHVLQEFYEREDEVKRKAYRDGLKASKESVSKPDKAWNILEINARR